MESGLQGARRIAFDEIDSTNAEARRRIDAGERGPLWIAAGRQTEGRGRRGRRWTSPAGNLSASLILPVALPPAEASLYSFVASLAVADMVAAAAPAAPVAVKWPNDVLLAGRKVSGILLESAGAGGALETLVIGVGVNLAHAPPAGEEGAWPTTAIADHAAPPSPEEALDALAKAFARHAAQFRRDGFGPIRDAWLSRAARLGEPVEARLPGETLRGVFEDLDPAGAMILRTGAGPRAIAAAEVHFPAAGAA